MEEKILQMMKALKCSREEAIDVIESDKAIDKGERVYFDLSEKEEREAIKMSAVKSQDRTKKEDSKRGKVKPPNELKERIVFELSEFLKENYENVEIVNKNRLINFKCGDKSFDLTLVQKRK